MDFGKYLQKGIELVKLNRAVADEVAADDNAFGPAVLFFAIGGLAGGLGATLISGGAGIAAIVLLPLFHVIGSFISVGILYIIARLLGGTGTYRSYYCALGIGSIPAWAQVVPVLGGIVSLWSIPVAVIVTERVHKMSTGRAIMVILIPVVIALIIALAVIALVGIAAFTGLTHNSGLMNTI